MPTPAAASLLPQVGLLADGPLPWGRPVPARRAGVFIIELAAPMTSAPIELTKVGKWLERVPTLLLDGERPTSRALAARIASFWLPSQVVLYIGATDVSIGGRVGAMERTVLGDRRPASGGHWLKVLSALPSTRVWWAPTDAAEEYEDALFSAFAAGVPEADLEALPDRSVVLPFANLRRPTGERRSPGLTGSLLVEAVEPPPPPTHVVDVPDGDAEGAHGEPPAPRRRVPSAAAGVPGGTSRRAPAPTSSRAGGGGGAASAPRRAPAPPPTATPGGPAATLTAEGAERLRAELTELTQVKRPEVIARIRAAKELGDLKENADYSSAREEQSFLEGRVQALEARLRDAVIAVVPASGAGADLGSRITVEIDGMTDTYTLVGTAEADPGAGRLSVASPVGRALLGARPGAEVAVQTPRGAVSYRVITVD